MHPYARGEMHCFTTLRLKTKSRPLCLLQIEYFLPGVAPTNKRLRIPMVGIVNLRGDKLAFESLYWDQASALVQLGLLDPKEKGGLPIAGQEVPDKVLDPFGVPSNELLTNWKLSEHLPIPGLSS